MAIEPKPEDPNANSSKVGPPSIPFTKLFTFATAGDITLLVLGALAAAIAGAAQPVTSVFFGRMIDAFSDFQLGAINANQFQAAVNANALYFVYLAAGVFITTYLFMSCYVYVGGRLAFNIRSHYLNAVLRQEVAWFDGLGAGEVATRITSDTSLIQDGVSEKVALIVHDLATFVSGFVVSFVASWRLTLVVLCVIPVMAITIGFLNFFASRFATESLSHYSDAGTLAEESIASVRTAMAFNQQPKLEALYANRLQRAERAGLRKALSVGVGVAFIFFFIYCGYSLAFYYGGTLILDGLLTSGKVVNVFFAVLIGAFSLGNVAPNLQTLSIAKGAGAKIFQAIDRKPKIDAYDEGGERPAEVTGRIEFRDVNFAYPSRPEVAILKGYSLTVEAGSTVALVGESGSGKSTIIQLLERFYEPQSGQILLDGRPIQTLNLKWLRRQIGLVSQEPTLFSGTIAQNIGAGLIGTPLESATEEKRMAAIREACELANAHEFIAQLPDAYETQVGERGFLLSGGQKQRIAIARAIVKDPKILLLDEATSALDTQSEAVVQEALDRAARGRTTITIAHRLSTIKDSSVIVVMERGLIREAGTHQELLSSGGIYHRLVAIQEVDGSEVFASASQEDNLHAEIVKRAATLASETHDLCADPESGEGARKPSAVRMAARLYRINREEAYLYVLGVLGAMGLGLIYPIFAIVFSRILAVFQEHGDALRSGTNFWSLIFLLIAFGAGVATFAQLGCFGLSAEKLTTRLRVHAFAAILRQEAGWFDRDANATGALTAMLSTQAQDIQGLSGVTLGTIVQVLANLVGSILVGLIHGWKLALAIIATLPVIIGAGYVQVAMSQRFQENHRKAYARSAEVACEAAAAIKTVAALTKEAHVMRSYAEGMRGPLRASFRNAFLASLAYAAAQCFNFLINALGFWYGATLFQKGEFSYRDFFVVFIALVVGCSNIGRSLAYGPDILKAAAAARSLFALLDRQPQIASPPAAARVEAIGGRVEFRDVVFQYPTRPAQRILKKVSFVAQPGQFVALVGPSGCGKSTCISLLERFYDVSGGQVTIDHRDIRDYCLPDLRDQLALVSQEPALYNLSFRENILFGAKSGPTPTQAQVEAAAKMANIHDFIVSLPAGYDTLVGGKGSQLSGGQKQRVAIARALLRDPKVLLLDEATSALDADSERVVQLALDSASKGRTTLAVAHRLSTIQHADLILVFHNGRVVEAGTHQSLLTLHGRYYEMPTRRRNVVTTTLKPRPTARHNIAKREPGRPYYPPYPASRTPNLLVRP
ncbi:hypothetical protein L0F63_006768, partial [Massospora cicadina]